MHWNYAVSKASLTKIQNLLGYKQGTLNYLGIYGYKLLLDSYTLLPWKTGKYTVKLLPNSGSLNFYNIKCKVINLFG